MEIMFLEAQFLPVLGSLVAGGLLLVMAVCAVVYGWMTPATRVQTKEERQPLKKAA